MADTTEICAEETHSSSSPINTFSVPECTIVGVVVYQDRTEVTRTVTSKVVQGENEVIVKGLTKYIDSDSIRVEGKGPATITEVTYQAKHVPSKDEDLSKRNKELKERKESLQKQLSALESKKQRFVKQKNVLDGLADTVKSGGPISNKKDGDGQNFLDSTFLGNLSNFFEFYLKWATDLDDSICQIEDEHKTIQEEIQACDKNLGQRKMSESVSREMSILLDARDAGEVDLAFSYVASNASWTPKYDIRAFSNENILKVQYYGMIKQSTEEDWIDAKMSLSTAMPSIGGTVPTLGTMKLEFKRPVYPMSKSKGGGFMRSSFKNKKMKRSLVLDNYCMDEGVLMDDALIGAPAPMEVAITEVKESTTTTTFEVARNSTIPSDNTEHKVTIALFDLNPSFEYQSVPKKAAHAFFKAKVKNTSPYALLAGPTNIFLDNNFIAKTDLKAVSPSEEFECSLGVDPAVRVTYKPVHKYCEQSGMFSKTVTTTHRQEIEIKNTHTVPIKITVTDHLPKSSDEKIKVNLVEPVISKKKEGEPSGVKLNKDDNVEWNLDLAAGTTKELLLKYTVDQPANKEIDISFTSY